MLRRLALTVCLLAGGCVLQSPAALIADHDADPALARGGTRFSSYAPAVDGWSQDVPLITLTPEGRHFILFDGTHRATVSFLALGGNWWGAEISDPGEEAFHGLVERRGGDLYGYPLACDALRKDPGFSRLVRFDGSDCHAAEGADMPTIFKQALAHPGKPTLKLVALP